MTNKILYGDDRVEFRNSLERELRSRGFEVDLVSTPQEVIDRARSNKYAAVVTDLEYTPNGREGYEVLRQIRDLPTLKFLYSGVTGFEYASEAFEHGADYAVLSKHQSDLVEILENEFGGRK